MQELKTGRTAKGGAGCDAVHAHPPGRHRRRDGAGGCCRGAVAVHPAGEAQQCPYFESQLADLEEAS